MKLQRKGEFLSTRVQYIPLGRIGPIPSSPGRALTRWDWRSWPPASAPAAFYSR